MANLICRVHWDAKNKEVVKTYQVLNPGPKDTVQLITNDAAPFIIKTNNARLAKQLGLEKAPNGKGNGLYQVKKANSVGVISPKPGPTPAWLLLKCGTLGKEGKFLSWGGLGPPRHLKPTTRKSP